MAKFCFLISNDGKVHLLNCSLVPFFSWDTLRIAAKLLSGNGKVLLPFAQEKAGETALQASLRDSAEEMLILANSLVFVTRMALQANLPMWQTFW